MASSAQQASANPHNTELKPILAMWSGPRNLSTAMMRAWENRPDTEVWDEPFYAAYLQRTGLDHPMGTEIIAHHEADVDKVIERCTTPSASGFFYQKHMTHHMLPEYPLDWLAELSHCFLLRDPREVLLSYSQKREDVTLDDIGVPQQLRLYEWVLANLEQKPLVIDARDFLQQPQAYLEALCAHVGIPFYQEMLSWPAGRRDSDGIWSEHWYDSVWKSTGFGTWQARTGELDAALLPIYREADEIYQAMREQRLRID